jgi:hypothetical protein
MFEKAVRSKFRFLSPQGALTVEDLWDLPLTSTRANQANLNNIAKDISRQIKAEGEEDFVNPKNDAGTEFHARLEIVKHIIQVKQAENEAARNLADRRAKKDRIMEIVAKKQDQELEGKSLEELTAMVADL